MKRAAVAFAVVGGVLLASGSASAHLISAERGTVNVVAHDAFTVLSVPVSSLHGADDDADGLISQRELALHEAALRDQIDQRLALFDGPATATTVRIDLLLSPSHDGPNDRADQLVVLKHARFAAPPTALRVRCDLFGRDGKLSFAVTRNPSTGKESEQGELTPQAPERAFFQPMAPTVGLTDRAPRGLLPVALLFAAAGALSWANRARAPKVTASVR